MRKVRDAPFFQRVRYVPPCTPWRSNKNANDSGHAVNKHASGHP
jgi:hypothetical protein